MARRDFSSISSSPPEDAEELSRWLSGLANNTNLLAGLLGDQTNFAVLRGDVSTALPGNIQAQQAAQTLAALSVMTAIIANDLNNLRNTLYNFMQEVKGN